MGQMGAMIHFLALLPTKFRQATERVGFCQHFPLCFRASEVGLCGRLIAEQLRREQLSCHQGPPSSSPQSLADPTRPRSSALALDTRRPVDHPPTRSVGRSGSRGNEKNQPDDGENGRRGGRSVCDTFELSRGIDTASNELARRDAGASAGASERSGRGSPMRAP